MNVSKPREVPAAIAQLRAEIEQLPRDQGGKRRNIPLDLKRRVAAQFPGSGMRLEEYAEAISSSPSAISCWRKQFGGDRVPGGRRPRLEQEPGFRKVAVLPDPAPAPTGMGITIEGPGGMRITGLPVEEVVRLWRALC